MGDNKKTKKKVIKVGVGKPFIRPGKTGYVYHGVDDETGKLRTIHNAIDTIFKLNVDKKITNKTREKMIDAVLKAQKDQLKNKTYFK